MKKNQNLDPRKKVQFSTESWVFRCFAAWTVNFFFLRFKFWFFFTSQLRVTILNCYGAEYLFFVSSHSLKTRERYINSDNLACLSLYISWGQSHLCLLLLSNYRWLCAQKIYKLRQTKLSQFVYFALVLREWEETKNKYSAPKRGEIASTVGKDSGDQAKWKMCFFIPPWSWKRNENWVLDRFLQVEVLWSVFVYGRDHWTIT